MILRFGKHKGEHISDVPTEYLEWLLSQNKNTVADLEEELERRIAAESANLPIIQQVIQAGYIEHWQNSTIPTLVATRPR